jgi:NAD(P)-dependent dehydrogenase (short-subunit alcohol dehydrogenase family)
MEQSVSWNPLDLTGRTILVTGASSGIGREAAVTLSRLGARLVLVARNSERLSETRSALAGDGHRVAAFDLSNVEAIPDWMKSLAAESGPLDGLVHSAGVVINRPLRFMSGEALDSVMRVNFTSAVHLAKGFRQKQVCRTPASVVFVSSVMGLTGQPGLAAYCASKGALIALVRSLAVEHAAEGIRFNCVAPGQVRTEMTAQISETMTPEQFAAIGAQHPLGLGEAADVASAIAFLLADSGKWITGTSLVVDGGYTAK